MAYNVQWPLPQYEVLRVHFMNPSVLSTVNLCKQKVIGLANLWNPTGCANIPKFKLERDASKANIRVSVKSMYINI